MWCIGVLNDEYRRRMYALLELYARPMSRVEPVICIDEKSLQLISDSRERLPMAPQSPAKQDYEYVRNGTTNLFVAVEPKGGKRVVLVKQTPLRQAKRSHCQLKAYCSLFNRGDYHLRTKGFAPRCDRFTVDPTTPASPLSNFGFPEMAFPASLLVKRNALGQDRSTAVQLQCVVPVGPTGSAHHKRRE
jgi:hypothetical protein